MDISIISRHRSHYMILKRNWKNSDLKARKERCVWDIMAKMVKMNQPDIKDLGIVNTFISKQQDARGAPWE